MCGPETINAVHKNLQNRRGFLTAAAAASVSAIGIQQSLAKSNPETAPGQKRIVDLSHALTPDFPTFVGESTFAMEQIVKHEEKGWNHFRWTVNEHTGTHLDAPIHRSAKGHTADQIDVSEFLLPLVVVEIKAKAAKDPSALLTLEDLKNWEQKHGPIPQGACVALNSGWDAHVKTKRFRGADENGVLHFPGFHEEVAIKLLEEKQALALATDTLSIDVGNTTTAPTHTRWLPAGRWAIECVANLDSVPAQGARIFVGLPKVAGATGGPCRVLAMV